MAFTPPVRKVNKVMKKFIIIAALIAIAPLSLHATPTPPPDVVPDGGSSLMLLAAGIAGLVGLGRRGMRR